MAKYVDTVQCRVETCDRTAPRFGPYAGRCDLHRNGDLETPDMLDDLDVRGALVTPTDEPNPVDPDDNFVVELARQVTEAGENLQQAKNELDDAIARLRAFVNAERIVG